MQALKTSNYKADPLLGSAGISISDQFTQVEGRILPTPKVSMIDVQFPAVVSLLSSLIARSFSGWHFRLENLCLYAMSDKNGHFLFLVLQLKVGRDQDLFPRNGRWNFNQKVGVSCLTILLSLLTYQC